MLLRTLKFTGGEVYRGRSVQHSYAISMGFEIRLYFVIVHFLGNHAKIVSKLIP